jgi:predicted TIM-barrel fold metal-dependent hydrolase
MWTEPLVAALAARGTLPFIRRSSGLTVLHAAGERSYVIDMESESPPRRAQLLQSDGLDLALIAISSPIGIEALPRDSAETLIDAHLSGIGELGDGFGFWGPLPLREPDPSDVSRLHARGAAGVSIPAGAMAGRDPLRRLSPVLEAAAVLRLPVFVHPGPAPRQRNREVAINEPLWWTALNDYVSQMHGAWLAFVTEGRRAHPDLQILFAMLAGGAPLLSERLEARGGPVIELRDPGVFYETSSYGPAAIEMMAKRVGAEQLLYGSDRPVAEPTRTGREAILQTNAAHFLTRAGAFA